MKARTIGLGTVLAMAVMMAGCEKKAAPASASAPPPPANPNAHVLVSKEGTLPKEGMKLVTDIVWTSKGMFHTNGPEGMFTQPVGEEEKRLESLEALSASRARYLLEKTERKITIDDVDRMFVLPMYYGIKGKALVVEGSAGFLRVSQESGRASDIDEILLLENRFNNDSSFAVYGSGKARKPGDRWEVHTLDLHEFCGITDLRGSFSVEFVEIAELQGTPCAVLKFTFDLRGKDLDEPFRWTEAKVSLKGASTCYRSLADQVNLDLRTQGTRRIEGKLLSPEDVRDISMAGRLSSHRDGHPKSATNTQEDTFTYRQKTRIEKR